MQSNKTKKEIRKSRCPICSKRRRLFNKLKTKFTDDLMDRWRDCLELMGMEFLWLKTTDKCVECRGIGYIGELDGEGERIPCPACNGTGKTTNHLRYIDLLKECPKCNSTLANVGTDFEQTKHIHKCKCGWKSQIFNNTKGVTW